MAGLLPEGHRSHPGLPTPGRPGMAASSSSQRDKQRDGCEADQQRDGLPHFQGCDVYQVATKWRPEGHPGRRRNPGGHTNEGIDFQKITQKVTQKVTVRPYQPKARRTLTLLPPDQRMNELSCTHPTWGI